MQQGPCRVKIFPSKSKVSQLGSCPCWGAVHTLVTHMSGDDYTTYQNAAQTSHRGTPVSLLFPPSPLPSPQAPSGAQPLPEAIVPF